jgi:hypothetical protein
MPTRNGWRPARAKVAITALALLALLPPPAMALDPGAPQWSEEDNALKPEDALPDAGEVPDEDGGAACPASETPLELLV